MKTYVVAFVIAAFVAALLTPVVRYLSFRWKLVSVPGGRHVHERVIPRLGGVAIFLAFTLPLMGLYGLETSVAQLLHEDPRRSVGLLVGGTLMFGLGLFDDVKGVRALPKLYLQVVAASCAFLCNFRIDAIELPLIGTLPMGVFALPVTVLWIVGIVNAVNLIDGLDGLAAGVVFFAAVTNFIVALVSGAVVVAVVMAAMAGAVFGFLFYNFNPARIFMGDSGSYFLGYILAVMGIAAPLQKASATVSLLVPIVALGIPIVDTLLAMVRRILERRPMFSADRGHIHHRLLDMGLTHRRAVLIIYGVCVLLSCSSVAIAFGRSWQVGMAILGVSATLFGLVRSIGYFEYLNIIRRQKSQIRSRQTEILRRLHRDWPFAFQDAESEDEVWSVLSEMVESGKFAFAGVFEAPAGDGLEGALVRRLGQPGPSDSFVERNTVMARFPFQLPDGTRWWVKFAWESEFGDVSPQTDILLQVLVDSFVDRMHAVAVVSAEMPAATPSEAPVLVPRGVAMMGGNT